MNRAPFVPQRLSAPTAQPTAEHCVVIEEAAQVLESAAGYNRAQGRTVLAHTQQDLADRLRVVLKALAGAPELINIGSMVYQGRTVTDWVIAAKAASAPVVAEGLTSSDIEALAACYEYYEDDKGPATRLRSLVAAQPVARSPTDLCDGCTGDCLTCPQWGQFLKDRAKPPSLCPACGKP